MEPTGGLLTNVHTVWAQQAPEGNSSADIARGAGAFVSEPENESARGHVEGRPACTTLMGKRPNAARREETFRWARQRSRGPRLGS